ncbi:hypothetical protein BDF19DRAFT_326909 [Syncephalis fuscata]|nr:hypothetical protein BDF19DRAFT_326909 [Syncephalis fuscata]
MVVAFSMSLTMLSSSLILLQKVYLVLCRQKWILYISIPIVIAQFTFVFILIYNSFVALEEKVGCMTYYSQFTLWYWFSVSVPINVIFSVIFCRVALKQYRIFGAKSWKKLASDGIQAMSLATLCNIIGPIITIVPKDKINTDLFFIVDCVVVTTILINHCQSTSKNIDFAHHPKTSHMLNISQIATAKS